MIEVSLLGPPRVERDGRRVVFETRKALALLALLALAERPLTRDALGDLLWPDQTPDRARGALRRTLSDLRTGIGPDLLEANHDQVRLVPGPALSVDVERFRTLARDGRAAEAVEVVRGDFLEGLAVRGAPEFEDWAALENESLRRELLATLEVLTDELEGAGDLTGAIRTARRWVGTDPLHEPAHRALIRLHAAAGDRAAALDQYRVCTETLGRELGVEPLPETTELAEAVRRGEIRQRPRPVAVVDAVDGRDPDPRDRPAPGSLPLVGRTDHLRAALAAYERIRADGGVVLVEGEPGIGKTRFVDELLVEVRGRGGHALVGRAYEDETGLAYAPVTEALTGAVRERPGWVGAVSEHALAEAARLVPQLVPARRRPSADAWPGGSPAAEARFLAGLWDTVVAAAGGERPGAVFVDDVGWADEATLAFLAYGLRRLAGRPLLVVLAVRPPLEHPLRDTVAGLVRAGSGVVIGLDRLREEHIASLVHAWGGDGDDAALVGRLRELTEGVPLLLEEYLRSGADLTEMPAGVRDVVRGRLRPLGATARQVLSAAAVLGRSFDVAAVRTVSGRTDDETVGALEEAVRHGLLVESPAGYDFAHDVLRGLVHEETGLARRQLLHGRAAQVPGLPVASLARHLQLAGRRDEAASAYLAAAEAARSVYANSEALEHYRTALELGHPDRARALTGIGDLLLLAGDYAGASESFALARKAGAAPGPLEQRAARVLLRTGDYEAAEVALRSALRNTAEDEPAHRADILADLSLAAHSRGSTSSARDLADEAAHLADASGDRRARCRTQNLVGVLATETGDAASAVPVLTVALELAEDLGDAELRVAVLNNLALAHRRCGDPSTGLALTRAALDLCAAVGDRHHEAALRNNLADLLHEAGDHEQAMEQLKAAVGLFAEIGHEDGPTPGVWMLSRW